MAGKAPIREHTTQDTGDSISEVTASGVVFLAADTGRCMLQLRNATGKRHSNTWGFWGGTMLPGETVYENILRELQEEIGFVPELTKLNPLDVYQSRDKTFYYYSFVYVVDSEFTPVLNSESAGYAWVDIGRWPQPLHQGARQTLARNKGDQKLKTIWRINR